MSKPAILALLAVVLACGAGCGRRVAPGAMPSRLREAWRETRCLNFRGARQRFAAIRRDAPAGSDAWIQSTLGLAVCLHHQQPESAADKHAAGALYASLAAPCAGRPEAPFILLQQARLADQADYHGDTPDPETARAIYDRIMREYPGTWEAGEASLYKAHLALASGQPDAARAAIADLRAWAADHPAHPLLSMHWLLAGNLYVYPLSDPAAALRALREAERAGLPPMTQLDAFFWQAANLAEQAGDADTAAAYYARIILECARSGYGYESQLRLKALGREPPPLTDPFDTAAPAASGDGSP